MSSAIQWFVSDYAFLDLTFRSAFYYDNDSYLSAAAAFEAAKILNRRDRVSFWGWNCKPWLARKLGKGIPRYWIRPDWDAVQFDVMTEIQRSKFSWPDLRGKLVATGDAQLVYGNNFHDNLWGICMCQSLPTSKLKYGINLRCSGSGDNRLARILMQVRQECQAGLHAVPVVPKCGPADDLAIAS